MIRLALLSLPLVLPAPAQGPAPDVYHAIRRSELELTADAPMPSYSREATWRAWNRHGLLWPRVALETPGEAYWVVDEGVWSADPTQGNAALHVRAPAGEVRGTLWMPTAGWDGMVALAFRIPADAPGGERDAFLAAKARHYEGLLDRGWPGAAWFRHERDRALAAAGAEPPARSGLRAGTSEEAAGLRTLSLASGGRAVAENLQLDRLLPVAGSGEETVAVDSLAGIDVAEIDWEPLLEGANPRVDVAAWLVAADQHALFFPSFRALVDAVDEAGGLRQLAFTSAELSAGDARTRERYERQLCLPLDRAVRAFAPLVVRSVTITGSDPYLRTGSDVAVFLETKDVDAVHRFVEERQSAAAERDASVRAVEGAVGELPYRGVVSPTRHVSSFVAQVNDVLVVTNALHQLEVLAQVLAGGRGSLAETPEYRFFRERYPMRGGGEGPREATLLVLTDATIRRWCSARWRIGTSRRTRAAAVLADLQAEHVDALVAGVPEATSLGTDARFPALGALELTDRGVRSETYGTLAFQTPIAELGIDAVSEEEARLYERWRDGYERNWSGVFDPIALAVTRTPDELALDLTVLPLILASDYRRVREIAGDARLAPASGDPHVGSSIHYVQALDPDSEVIRDLGELVAGFVSQTGADPLGWLGESMAIFVDESPFWDELLEGREADSELLDDLWREVDSLPLVVRFDVASPMKLAAFLAGLRALSEEMMPGLLRWEGEQRDGQRFVRISSSEMAEDASLLYATPPGALVLALEEQTLVRTLARLEERADGAAAGSADAPGWLGESMALEVSRAGLVLLYRLVEGARPARHTAWANLPILNEWKRRFPDRDPVELHERIFGTTLRCPGGGAYVWNAEWRTMESSVLGHPGRWTQATLLPRWLELDGLRTGVTFEHGGLRARVVLAR